MRTFTPSDNPARTTPPSAGMPRYFVTTRERRGGAPARRISREEREVITASRSEDSNAISFGND
jgi:hypothetical protein